jgi:hypothetical protein
MDLIFFIASLAISLILSPLSFDEKVSFPIALNLPIFKGTEMIKKDEGNKIV